MNRYGFGGMRVSYDSTHHFSSSMDGWMTRFYVLLTVFQSYQDKERVIITGCVQWNPASGRKLIASSGSRSRDSQVSPTELPGLLFLLRVVF